MLVLGIETSGLDGSAALMRDESVLCERHLNQTGRRHAQSLVLEIHQMLQAESLTIRDIELVAVSRGPGSFTGLRVGMVCAKTLAYTTGCRFISVDTFAAIAKNAPVEIMRLFVIEDAQREDLFVGEYARDEMLQWHQTGPIQIVSAEQFQNARSRSDFVTGPGVNKRDLISDSPNWLKEPRFTQPRASSIAGLGRTLSLQTQATPPSIDADFWRAVPFYLRLSAAEEKRASISESSAGSS